MSDDVHGVENLKRIPNDVVRLGHVTGKVRPRLLGSVRRDFDRFTCATYENKNR